MSIRVRLEVTTLDELADYFVNRARNVKGLTGTSYLGKKMEDRLLEQSKIWEEAAEIVRGIKIVTPERGERALTRGQRRR